jgi:hypothetical protein
MIKLIIESLKYANGETENLRIAQGKYKLPKTVILKADTKGAVKGVNDLEKSIDGVNKEIKETGASTDAMTGQLDKFTGGAVSGFKNMLGGVKGLVTGFKSMRVAIISTGIGALIIGIVALTAAFKGSEEGQNKFNKIMSVIGALTGNLVDLLADLGEGIINAFENPQKAISDFANLIKDNIVTRFEGLLNLIPNLGKAVEQLFKGNFKEAGKIAADSVGKVVLGVDSVTDTVQNATNAVKEFVKEQVREGEAAAAVADMRAKADKIERDLIVERSKLESEIALLRLKSRQEDQFSAEERKQALLDAQKLEDGLLDKETQYLKLRRDAQIQENTFSRSNKENLTKEAEAIAAVNRQVSSRANTARQVQREVNTISKQIQAEEKAGLKELSDLKKTLRDAEAVSEQEKRELELIKIQEHYDNLIAKANENNIKTDELETARDEAKELKQKEFDLKDAERVKKEDARIKKSTDDEIALNEKVKNAKVGMAKNALSLIGEIAGKGSKIAKGVAIAQATISGVEGTINAFKTASASPITTVFPGYPFVQAGLAAGFAAVNIASIKSTDPSKGGGGGGVKAPSGGGSAASLPPSFNVVGASETSALGDAVASQTNEPVQAYVVSNDVTTAQSLENNIVEGATI